MFVVRRADDCWAVATGVWAARDTDIADRPGTDTVFVATAVRDTVPVPNVLTVPRGTERVCDALFKFNTRSAPLPRDTVLRSVTFAIVRTTVLRGVAVRDVTVAPDKSDASLAAVRDTTLAELRDTVDVSRRDVDVDVSADSVACPGVKRETANAPPSAKTNGASATIKKKHKGNFFIYFT